ncbi:hypothetical protein CDA43_20760, partial [Klebsiella pneumoniae]
QVGIGGEDSKKSERQPAVVLTREARGPPGLGSPHKPPPPRGGGGGAGGGGGGGVFFNQWGGGEGVFFSPPV